MAVQRQRRWSGPANVVALAASLAVLFAAAVVADPAPIRFVDQGPFWTWQARNQFYRQDEGSQLIPLAWLEALRHKDGSLVLADSLQRYGYLPNPDPANAAGLPVGFTSATSARGTMVGMTCSACHTRQIEAGGATYRIDGAPAIADFGAFVGGLDTAVAAVLASEAAFEPFAAHVLGAKAKDPTARATLHAEVRVWWVRFHALVAGSIPAGHPWGPTRLDAIAVIYNFLGGLDIGPEPLRLMPDNIRTGDAPVRYPFLWNFAKQDFTQWTGIAEIGNETLGLARSLSEIYGVFAAFAPQRTTGSVSILDRNYLAKNSTSFEGLAILDGLIAKMGPPVWPWPVDAPLAERGKAIFDRRTAEGGCVECHGKAKGQPRPPVTDTWRTPILDVGTDTRAWQILLRSTKTGSMEGASVPGKTAPLRAEDLSLNLLKVSVLGAIVDHKVAGALDNPLGLVGDAIVSKFRPSPSAQQPASMEMPKPNRYEARVLHGVWAAAPYLHNASVPTLADLLEPVAQRPTKFEIGRAYDTVRVGLSASQAPGAFTLTTGCGDRNSGDSNCGHDYGTKLPADDKKALIEYLKTL